MPCHSSIGDEAIKAAFSCVYFLNRAVNALFLRNVRLDVLQVFLFLSQVFEVCSWLIDVEGIDNLG